MLKKKTDSFITTISLALAILLPLLPANANAQRHWTLDECMDYAIAHNSEMAQRLNEQKRREAAAQALRDARLPRFSGHIGGYAGTLHHSDHHNKFDATESILSLGLTGAVPLYTGGRLSSQIKAGQYSLLAAAEDVRTAEKNLRVQVAAACLQALYNKGDVTIAHQRLQVSQLLLQRARALFSSGKRPESDTVEAAAIVSRDEALLTAAEGNYTVSMLHLKQLLNIPDSIEFHVCQPADSLDNIQIHSNHYFTHTANHHPAVLSAHYSILQAQQHVTAAHSGYHPTLSLFGELSTHWVNLHTEASRSGHVPLMIPWPPHASLNYNLSGHSSWKRQNLLFGVVGLKLSIPIFDAFETKARIRTAKINLEDAKLAHHDALLHIQKDIRQAWLAAVTARKSYEAEIKAEEYSALAYRYALKRYDAGMATLFDLSQSRQQWFNAAENALRMKFEYLIRKKILDIETLFLTNTHSTQIQARPYTSY